MELGSDRILGVELVPDKEAAFTDSDTNKMVQINSVLATVAVLIWLNITLSLWYMAQPPEDKVFQACNFPCLVHTKVGSLLLL